MSMPVGVGTFAKYFQVFFVTPLGIVKLMGGVKMFFAGNKQHNLLIGQQIYYLALLYLRSTKQNFRIGFMNILLVSATGFEIAPLVKKIKADIGGKTISSHTYKEHQITILITGVGIAHTSFYLGKYLDNTYDLVINAGICGSFNHALSIGDVVRIEEDCFADLGAEDDEQFLSVEELNLPGTYQIKNETVFSHAALSGIKSVKGVTVNTTHGNATSIQKFLAHTKADVESMEGAAVLFACKACGINCLQLRAVSNYVEKRNRNKWDIPLAIENLNKALLSVIDA